MCLVKVMRRSPYWSQETHGDCCGEMESKPQCPVIPPFTFFALALNINIARLKPFEQITIVVVF